MQAEFDGIKGRRKRIKVDRQVGKIGSKQAEVGRIV